VTVSPKSILHAYSYDRVLVKPVYKTEEKKPERIYKSVLEFNGYFYTSPFWYGTSIVDFIEINSKIFIF
jgi:hypothetical protein